MVLTIMALAIGVVIPYVGKSLFGDEDALRAFLIKNMQVSMKSGKVVRILGDGKSLKSSEGAELDLPLRGSCYLYPSGDIRYCWFEKNGKKRYYTNLDL